MNEFRPSDYFDLTGFAHAGLVESSPKVWDILAGIKRYLAEFRGWGIHGKVHPGAWLEGDDIFIHETAVVEAGAFIKGPCIIGPGTEVRHCAYLRGNVIAGGKCVLGHTTEIKNAVFMDGAKAGHFAYVGDSVLGRNVNLGAGTKLANLKIIDSTVMIRHDGQSYETGLRKFGAILGDNVETGCNTVTMPGTIVGAGTVCYPNTTLRGVIAPGSVVKMAAQMEVKPLSRRQ